MRWNSLLAVATVLLACGGPPAAETPQAPALEALPARVRLLSNDELSRSLHAVLGKNVPLRGVLPAEVRQSGYTRNVAQPLSSSAAVRWAALVDELALTAAREDSATLLPCASSADAACRSRALARLGMRAWRRPLSDAELARVLALYQSGSSAEGETSALAGVLSALLQSPNFLYVSELGSEAHAQGTSRLDAFEIASALSYTLSGGPPDEALLEAASQGELDAASARSRHARRLLGKSETRHHFRRFVLEWLEVDRLGETAKDPEQYPEYDALKAAMLEETADYADEVMVHHGASVRALLTGNFAAVGPELARYYGFSAYGAAVPVSGTRRLGVLQQASVLAAHAHSDTTSPVKRGDFVLRRLLCTELPRPAELGIEVAMPNPEPNQTGRERFSRHVVNPDCQGCHAQIDPLGFSFEEFDAAGRVRREDAGKPVRTAVDWTFQGRPLRFEDSLEFTTWLADQAQTETCFARQAFRYFSAQTDLRAEQAFLDLIQHLPSDKRNNLLEMLVAYAGSEVFITRRSSSS